MDWSKGAPEMSVAPPGGQDRIMIYGPKSDGTYIIEFRMADGESLAISVPAGEIRVLKHFPGAHALWAVRAGHSVRNIRRARGVFPDGVLPAPLVRVPETPPGQSPFDATHSGGVLVGEPTRLTGARQGTIREKV